MKILKIIKKSKIEIKIGNLIKKAIVMKITILIVFSKIKKIKVKIII